MFRRYHHGHSIIVGFLLALALMGHMLVFALLVFAAGLVCGRLWATWALWASALREKWHLSRKERIHTTPQPVYERLPADDEIPF